MSKWGFKELRVWQKGKELAVHIYRITNIKYAFKIDIGTGENLLPLAICLSSFP
jgi:hypothetical protein